MAKIFFTSDTHFLDFRQVEIAGKKIHLFLRPFKTIEEQDELIISNWNSIVSAEDAVWHLGDFTTVAEGLEFRHRLNGKINLIRGNKEDIFSDELLLKYFDTLQREATVTLSNGETLNLVHYPVLAKENQFNLVGHVHKAWAIQANMLNVGVDVWNWRPVSEEEVIHIIHSIRNVYDQDCFPAGLPANQKNIGNIKKINTSYIWK